MKTINEIRIDINSMSDEEVLNYSLNNFNSNEMTQQLIYDIEDGIKIDKEFMRELKEEIVDKEMTLQKLHFGFN